MSRACLILLVLIAPLSAAAMPATQARSLDHELSNHSPDWSPDGRRIAFTSGRLGSEDVFVMAASGAQQRAVAKLAGSDADAAWSPDGSKIAFESDFDGRRPRDIFGHDGRVLAVGPGPQFLTGSRVERVRALPQRREVDDAVEDGRRPRDRPVRAEAPQLVTRCGVEGVEGSVVRSDQDAAPPDRGGGIDVTAGRAKPEKLAAARAERVHAAVGRADVDPPVGDSRRRVERAARGRPARPELGARARGERVHAPPVCRLQRSRPVPASTACIRPSQSPTKTEPPSTSGEDSVGPRRRRHRILPVDAANATSSPPRAFERASQSEDRFRNVSKTTPPATAGDAHPQRPEECRQMVFPVAASSA